MCPVESVSGSTIDTIDLNREQDADIRGLMANNEYDPETYAHNCKPVGIIYKKNKDILEKYFLTEFNSILGEAPTFRLVLFVIKLYLALIIF